MSQVPTLSAADKALRSLVTPGKFRGFAAAQLTGAFNANTAFGAANWPNSTLDIFAKAAAVDQPGKSPYNNFLDQAAKPMKTIYPGAFGLYIGDAPGAETEKIKTILAENAILEIEQQSTVILRQPALTIPGGLGVRTQVSDTATGERAFAEDWDFKGGVGLFEVRDNLVLTMDKSLKANLIVDAAALTYLAALGGQITGNRKLLIGVVVYGIAEYGVATNAA